MASRSGPFATSGKCLLHVRDTDISTAATLNSFLSSINFHDVPRPDIAVLSVEGTAGTDGIRWRADGTSPTSTVGHLVDAGQTVILGTSFSQTELIETTTDAILQISFYAT